MIDYEPAWIWIRKREAARCLKDSGAEPPYTEDPVISKFRFCNVRREDDRVTQWIRENIRERFADHKYLWFMLCIARQINWPETLEELIWTGSWPDASDFEPSLMTRVLNDRKARGDKVYTGAYMISAPSTKGADKQAYISEEVCGGLWDRRNEIGDLLAESPHLQQVHSVLRKTNGWGNFMAYQAVVDMRFTPLLSDAFDLETWAAAGPGTLRGLNRLHGRPFKQSLNQTQALEEMQDIYAVAELETSIDLDFSDIPNVLCETDKYIRVLNGEGTPRALYVPGRGG